MRRHFHAPLTTTGNHPNVIQAIGKSKGEGSEEPVSRFPFENTGDPFKLQGSPWALDRPGEFHGDPMKGGISERTLRNCKTPTGRVDRGFSVSYLSSDRNGGSFSVSPFVPCTSGLLSYSRGSSRRRPGHGSRCRRLFGHLRIFPRLRDESPCQSAQVCLRLARASAGSNRSGIRPRGPAGARCRARK
jgi:hypothetical protein